MKNIIGIYGDSFADPRSESEDTPWMQMLGTKHVNCYGSSGTSQWWSFEKFLRTYQRHAVIIFTYAASQRIHSIPDEWGGNHYRKPDLNASPIFSDNSSNNGDHIESAIETYWKYFYNERLDNFVQQKVFDEINILCKQRKIKLVNLFTTLHVPNTSHAAGPCFNGVYEISKKELQVVHPNAFTPVDIGHEMDVRACHLVQENNEILADAIRQAIQQHSFDTDYSKIINLPKHADFVFDPTVTNRYFD